MSGSINSSATSSIHTPLSQVCPWQDNETVLVMDSVESDGRFVLCTLVAAALSQQPQPQPQQQQQQQHANNKANTSANNVNVLWLCCTAITDQLTLAALKKMGCDKAATSSAHLPEQQAFSLSGGLNDDGTTAVPSSARLTIRSISTLLDHELSKADDSDEVFNEEAFVKGLYRQVKEWWLLVLRDASTTPTSRDHFKSPPPSVWVILDDVSALASLVGERLAYELVLSLQALKSNSNVTAQRHLFGLALRCSNDSDIEAAGLTVTDASNSADWFGAGGEGDRLMMMNSRIPWERALVELADTVVDVLPLASGYTREAHGRLIFTGRSTSAATTTSIFNYCLTDNQVLAIRISSQAGGR